MLSTSLRETVSADHYLPRKIKVGGKYTSLDYVPVGFLHGVF